jgi:hypothetical protein
MRFFFLPHLRAYANVAHVTVRAFLEETKIPLVAIAKRCGVHVSQVFRWKTGKSFPESGPLLHLVEISKRRIRAKDLPLPRRGRHFRKAL